MKTYTIKPLEFERADIEGYLPRWEAKGYQEYPGFMEHRFIITEAITFLENWQSK